MTALVKYQSGHRILAGLSKNCVQQKDCLEENC